MLGKSFEESQLWGNSFGQQLVATLGRSFREPLCRMALGSRFGEQVCRIAALGQQLWRTALGHSSGERREQLWRAALVSSFGEQLWGLALERNFGEQLSAAILRSKAKPLSCSPSCRAKLLLKAARAP